VLLLDGVVLKERTGVGARKRVVLVALGIRPDGRKEVIDFMLARGESQAAWEAFLNQLYARGLRGETLDLIVKDGGQGLSAALPLVYPRVAVQRCWAHKSRNILNKVRRDDRNAVKADLTPIYQAANRRQAIARARHFIRTWDKTYPKAVQCLREGWDELLSFLALPREWRVRSRTTNAIERRFREVRRRTRPMGVFSDRSSTERILFAIFSEENRNQRVGTMFTLTQTGRGRGIHDGSTQRLNKFNQKCDNRRQFVMNRAILRKGFSKPSRQEVK
jgi:transposase-like protein